MSEPAQTKSAHLQKLEETFTRRTRRFSPFTILGLESETAPVETAENADGPLSPSGGGDVDPPGQLWTQDEPSQESPTNREVVEHLNRLRAEALYLLSVVEGGEAEPRLRQAQEELNRAYREKTLAEEALWARQEAARARFLASLEEAQMQWLKQESKRRVDARPEAHQLNSRYPLYSSEEADIIAEWMDRVMYGETVPHHVPDVELE